MEMTRSMGGEHADDGPADVRYGRFSVLSEVFRAFTTGYMECATGCPARREFGFDFFSMYCPAAYL